MKSLVLTGEKTLVLEEVDARLPGPGETALRVECCALCRTDAKMWEKGQRDLVLPRVLGHEICGLEESTGARFVVWPGRACGTCPECTSGYENLCPHMRILGFNRDGGLADQVLVPREALIPIKDDIPAPTAALAEPLACCLNALNQVRAGAGERILVFGAGPVGLLAGMAALSRGAVPVLVEKNPEKLSRSAEFCRATGIKAHTNLGSGSFDICINAASAVETFSAGIERLRPRGRFVLFSGFPGKETLCAQALNEIHYRQLLVAGAYGCTRADMVEAVGILDLHRDSVGLIIERSISLEEVPLVMARIAGGQALKIAVIPGRSG
ncbi:MAG: alcohol dehydrogenase catalytic domain-containing protein [Thermodesulfobacteriota bacterium]